MLSGFCSGKLLKKVHNLSDNDLVITILFNQFRVIERGYYSKMKLYSQFHGLRMKVKLVCILFVILTGIFLSAHLTNKKYGKLDVNLFVFIS